MAPTWRLCRQAGHKLRQLPAYNNVYSVGRDFGLTRFRPSQGAEIVCAVPKVCPQLYLQS